MNISQSSSDSSFELATTPEVVTVNLIKSPDSNVYTDIETGINKFSISGLSREFKVPHQRVSDLAAKYENKSLKVMYTNGSDLAGNVKYLVDGKSLGKLRLLSEDAYIYCIKTLAIKGNEIASDALDLIIKVGVRQLGHMRTGYQTQAPAPEKPKELPPIPVELCGTIGLILRSDAHPMFQSCLTNWLVSSDEFKYELAKRYLEANRSQLEISLELPPMLKLQYGNCRMIDPEYMICNSSSEPSTITLSMTNAEPIELQAYPTNNYLTSMFDPLAQWELLSTDELEAKPANTEATSNALALYQAGELAIAMAAPSSSVLMGIVESERVFKGNKILLGRVCIALKKWIDEKGKKPFIGRSFVTHYEKLYPCTSFHFTAKTVSRDHDLIYNTLRELCQMGYLREPARAIQANQFEFIAEAATAFNNYVNNKY